MQGMEFFTWLLDQLFPPKDTERLVRESTEESLFRLVSPMVTPSGAIALLPYRNALVRALIIEAKFKRNPKAISLLATVLREYIQTYLDEDSAWGEQQLTVIPIPLGHARLRERGYNQVEEIARASGVPLDTHMLVRSRETEPQTTLPRAKRLENMKFAFVCSVKNPAEDLYILFDDVTTTGSTLTVAAEACASCGISNVIQVALAH